MPVSHAQAPVWGQRVRIGAVANYFRTHMGLDQAFSLSF